MAKMPSILEYTKRVGRSMAYGAFDAIKETMPITSSLIENNAQTARDLYKEVTQSKTQLNRLKTMQDTYLFKPANQLMKNLKADLRSGNFYHPERAAKAEEQGAQDMMKALLAEEGMEDLMDLLNGDEELSPEEMQELPVTPDASITTGDAVVATTIAKEQRRATHASVDAHTKIAEAQMATQRTLSNIQLKHMERHTHITIQGFNKMTDGFNNIMQFNQEVVLQHAKNSQQYFTEMTQLTRENNAILKEFIEMKRAQFKRDESIGPKGPANPFANGTFNLKDYINMVKGSFDNSVGGSIGVLVAAIPTMIAAVVANPVHFASKSILKNFLGPSLRDAMKSFDKNITGYMQTALAKLWNWGNNPDSGLIGSILKKFGINTQGTKVRSVDISKALKGPRQWDAEDHHFLTKVIPSYLSNIEAAISGKEARHFSSDTGKWTTASAMKEKYRKQEQNLADTNTAELQKYLKNSLYSTLRIDPKDKRSAKNREELDALIRDFALGVQKQGGLGVGVGDDSHYKDILNNKNNVYGNNQNVLNLIYDLIKKADTDKGVRRIVLGTNTNVINSKYEQSQRISSGKLTDIEKWVNSNSDLNSNQLRKYEQLSMSLEIAKAQGDTKRVQEIQKVLDNFGSDFTPSTSKSSSKIKGGTRHTDLIGSPIAGNKNLSLLDWQSKIYEVLVEIRDARGLGQPKRYRNRARGKRTTKSKQKSSTTSSQSDDEDGPSWDDIKHLLYGSEASSGKPTGLLNLLLNDAKSAEKIRSNMNHKIDSKQDARNQSRIKSESGFFDSLIGSDKGIEDINKNLESLGVDPKANFFKQLAMAGTIGDKMGVISANINKLIASPRAIMTSVITAADNMMYDLLFGKDTGEKDANGNPIKGFFNKMVHEMGKAGDIINNKISDIANLISQKKGEWWKKAKDMSKSVLGFDVDKVISGITGKLSFFGNSAKDAGKSIVGDIKDAVKGTITDIRENNFNQQKQKDIPGKAYGQYPAIVSKGEAVFNSDGSGTKNVTKSGVTTIDDDSVVIPSNRNPWNPNRSTADPKRDLQNENRIRGKITSKMSGSKGAAYAKSLPGFGEGTDPLQAKYEEGKGILPFANQFILQATGSDPEKAMEETKKYIIKNTPELMKGGMAGALMGAVFPLGGPLMGALAGSAVSILSNNKSFMEYMFGEEVVDDKGNKSRKDNGLISKSFMKSFEKYWPDAKKYSIAGSLLGMVTGFGPLGGVMAGVAASFIKNNESANKFIFGDSLKGKDRKAALKKAFPALAASVTSTLFLGPFGLLGNAVLGAGLGLLATSESFKKLMLGAKDKQGVRHGGIAGAIKRHIVNPLKFNMKQMKRDFGKWFREDVTKPLGKGLKPIADEIKNQLKKGTNTILDTIEGALSGSGTLMEKIFDNTFGGIRRAGGFGKWVAQNTVGKAVGGLSKGIEWAGNKLRAKQLRNAELTNLSSADALREMSDRGIVDANMQNYYEKLSGKGEQTIDEENQLLQAMAMATSKKARNAAKRTEGEAFDRLKSTIAKVSEKGDYSTRDKDLYENLLDLATKAREGSNLDQKEVGKKIYELTEKAGVSLEDIDELNRAFLDENKVFTKFKKSKEWDKNHDSTAFEKGLEWLNNEYFGGKLSREELIKKIPQLTEFHGNEIANRNRNEENYVDQAQKMGANADKSAFSQTDAIVDNSSKLSDLTKAIIMDTASRTGQDPSQLAKGLQLSFGLGDIDLSVRESEAYLKEGMSQGVKERGDKRNKTYYNLEDMGTFDTVQGLTKENAHLLLNNNDHSNKFARSFLELSKARAEGNKAIVQDFNAIFKIDRSGELFSRIADLTILGLEVDPSQYKDIDDLDDVGFQAAVKMAKLHVPINDFTIFKDIRDHEGLGDAMERFASAKIIHDDGSTTALSEMTTADHIHRLLVGDDAQSGLINEMRGKDKDYNFLDKYLNTENPDYIGDKVDILGSSREDRKYALSTYKQGADLDSAKKQVSKSDVFKLTGRKEGAARLAQVGMHAAGAAGKKILGGAGSLVGKTLDIATMGAASGVYNTAREILAYANGSEQFKQEMDQIKSDRRVAERFKENNVLGEAYEMLKEDSIILTKAISINPVEAANIASKLVDHKIEVPMAISLLKSIAGTKDGDEKDQGPASQDQIDAANAMPQHALGQVAKAAYQGFKAGGWKGAAKGLLAGGGLGALAGSLFGGDNDKKDESSENSDSSGANAGSEIAGGISSGGLGTALGAAAGFINSGQQVMGSAMSAPLKRGETVVIPTAFGPKTFTTSSTDGGMMEAHTKDNSAVDAKEQADIDRKERVVSALEKISGKMGNMGGKAKKLAKKAGGGLLDSLLGLAGLPFTMISGLVGSLIALPIIGPIFGAILSPLKGIFSKVAEKFGVEVGEKAGQEAAEKAGQKPGLIKSVIKKVMGSKWVGAAAVIASFLGINLLGDEDGGDGSGSSGGEVKLDENGNPIPDNGNNPPNKPDKVTNPNQPGLLKQVGASIAGSWIGKKLLGRKGPLGALVGTIGGGMLGVNAVGGDYDSVDLGVDLAFNAKSIYDMYTNPAQLSNMDPEAVAKMDNINNQVKAHQDKIAELKAKANDPNISGSEKRKLIEEMRKSEREIATLKGEAKSIADAAKNSASSAAKAGSTAAEAGEKAAQEAAENSKGFFSKIGDKVKDAKDFVGNKITSAKNFVGEQITKGINTATKAFSSATDEKGIITKAGEALKYIKDGAVKYLPGGSKFQGAVNAACDWMSENIKKPKFLDTITKKLSKQAFMGIPVIGWIITAGFVATGIYEGLAHTEEMLKIPEGKATTGMRVFAGVVGALTGAPIIGLLPAQWIVDGLMAVADFFGFDPGDLNKLRKQKEDEDKAANKAADDHLLQKQADELNKYQTQQKESGSWERKVAENTAKDTKQVGNQGANSNNNSDSAEVKKRFDENAKKNENDPEKDKKLTREERIKKMHEEAQKRIDDMQGNKKQNKSLVRRGLDWVGEKWDNFWGNNRKDNDKSHGGQSGGFGKYGRGDHALSRQDIGPRANTPFNIPGDTERQTERDSACAAYSLENVFNGTEGTDPSGRRIGSLVQESLRFKHKNDGVDPMFIHAAATSRGYQTEDLKNQSDLTNALESGKKVVGMGQGSVGPWGPGMHYEQFEKGSKPGYVKAYDSEESEVKEYPIKDVSAGMSNAISIGKGKYGRSRRPWWFGRAKDFMNPEEIAIEISKNTKLPPELIWAQMALETGHFKSELAKEHNYGGVKSAEGSKDKSGKYTWTVTGEDARHHSYFNNDQSFVNYMSWYYPLYKEDGLLSATSPAEWAAALKHGNYFTADENQYAANIKGILEGDPEAVKRLKENRPSDAPPLNMNGGSSTGTNGGNSSGGGNGGLFEAFFGAVNAALGTSLAGQYIKNVFGSDFKFGSNGATATNTTKGTPSNGSGTVVDAPLSGSAAEAITQMMGGAPITSPYGPRGGRLHAGIDIGVSDGTDVPCPVDGIIDDIGNDANGYGDYVVVKDKNGNYHIFGHNSNNKVCSKGDNILAGTVVAKSGHSGHCEPEGPDGAHVHYGIYPPDNPNCSKETPINPATFKIDGLATKSGRGKYGRAKRKAKVTGFTTGSDAGWKEDSNLNYNQKRRMGMGKYGRGSQDSIFMQDLKMANSMDPLKNIPAQLKATNSFGETKENSYGFGRGKFGRGSEGVPEKVWNFLSPKIGSVATAAVMGNMQAESGYDPAAVNSSSGASGLCQWLGNRKTAMMNKAQSMGKDWTDLDSQLEYLWEEMDTEWQGKTYKQWLNEINNAGDVEEGAVKWEKIFERSGHEASYPRRKQAAKEAFEKQGKGIKTNGAATTGSSGENTSGGKQDNSLFGWFKSKVDQVIANSPVGAIWRAVWGTPGGSNGGTSGANASSGQSLSGVKETGLSFNGNLTKRDATNKIIIHHTGDGDENTDPDAKTIHGWHQKNGWAGIGYHFVIRKDGSIERGRPEEMMGSHAQGSNNDSIGIHVGGAFDKCQPTEAQIGSLVNLIRDLCKKYNIPVDRKHIIGHREVNQTSCPGNNLYSRLDDIVKRAASGGVASAPATKSDSGSSSTVPPAEAAKKEDAVATNAGAEEKKDKNGNTDIYSQENEWVKQNKADAVYSKNDIDYLMKQGYSMQDAVWYLRNQNGQGKFGRGKFGRGKYGLGRYGRSAAGTATSVLLPTVVDNDLINAAVTVATSLNPLGAAANGVSMVYDSANRVQEAIDEGDYGVNSYNADSYDQEALEAIANGRGKYGRGKYGRGGIGDWFNRITGSVRDFFSGGKKPKIVKAPYGIASNGLPYSKNDVDYLLKQGYTKEDAIRFLSKDKRYTEPLTPEHKAKLQGKKQRGIGGWFNRIAGSVRDFFSGGKKQNETTQAPYGVGPNGLPYSKNDVEYLLKQGYTKEDAIQLLSKDKRYTEPLTPEQKAKITAKTGKQMDPFSKIFSNISNIFNPTASSMQNALNLGGLARSRTSNPGLSIGNITGNPTVDGILGAVVPGIGQVTGQASSRTPVRTTRASQHVVDNTSFTELLEEQKKTNSLLEGILKAIVANGQAAANNNQSVPGMNVFGGNSGYMADLNGKSYTPIARSLEWLSEPK